MSVGQVSGVEQSYLLGCGIYLQTLREDEKMLAEEGPMIVRTTKSKNLSSVEDSNNTECVVLL